MDYKTKRSHLRRLLNIFRHTRRGCQVGQFAIFYNHEYYVYQLYNMRTSNVIATYKHAGGVVAVRFRPTSHYADILTRKELWPDRGCSVRLVPSMRLGQHRRLVQRNFEGVEIQENPVDEVAERMRPSETVESHANQGYVTMMDWTPQTTAIETVVTSFTREMNNHFMQEFYAVQTDTHTDSDT